MRGASTLLILCLSAVGCDAKPQTPPAHIPSLRESAEAVPGLPSSREVWVEGAETFLEVPVAPSVDGGARCVQQLLHDSERLAVEADDVVVATVLQVGDDGTAALVVREVLSQGPAPRTPLGSVRLRLALPFPDAPAVCRGWRTQTAALSRAVAQRREVLLYVQYSNERESASLLSECSLSAVLTGTEARVKSLALRRRWPIVTMLPPSQSLVFAEELTQSDITEVGIAASHRSAVATQMVMDEREFRRPQGLHFESDGWEGGPRVRVCTAGQAVGMVLDHMWGFSFCASDCEDAAARIRCRRGYTWIQERCEPVVPSIKSRAVVPSIKSIVTVRRAPS